MQTEDRDDFDDEVQSGKENISHTRSERLAKAEAIHKKKVDFIFKTVGFCLVGLQTVLTALFALFVHNLNVLPPKYYILTFLVLGVLAVVFFVMQFRKIPGIIAKVISVILSVCLCFGCIYSYKTKSALKGMYGTTEVIQMNVYVLADDPAQELIDTEGYTFGILPVLDREHTDKVISQIKEATGEEPKTSEFLMPDLLASALYNKDVKAIILNQAQISLIEDHENLSDFSTKTRVISTIKIENALQSEPDVNISDFLKDDTFSVYVSGIDTYDSEILANSRSDVNILMFVNKKTKQVLLLSTPRDTYVYIPSYDYYDKLTHAGNNGINSSMDALKQYYDIDIDYYFKVNFKGFESIVDTLGGISVYSEHAFTSTLDSSIRKHIFKFKQGYNDVDGERALVFARERHAFADGDFQRGRDQMAVIQAIFKKLCSPAILTSYTGLLKDVQNYFKTDMTSDEIAELVKMQLDDGAEWNIKTFALEGDGEILKTNGRWVLKPYKSYVTRAMELIAAIEDGTVLNDEMLDVDNTMAEAEAGKTESTDNTSSSKND